ncbi:MAG: GIY-YIG nuclease family protein [Planctomycetes bacterium]|nr:GIY-YIG nuclease family protein [Planctomycetota bacterium]
MSATQQQFFIYILKCADDAYYVGSTTDVPTRLESHNAGRGPRFTACRRPVTLIYSESFGTMEQARQREIQIKKWSRAKKEALIGGDRQTLHTLSRRKTR